MVLKEAGLNDDRMANFAVSSSPSSCRRCSPTGLRCLDFTVISELTVVFTADHVTRDISINEYTLELFSENKEH